MAINVSNPEADALTRKLAEMEGVGITEAILIAMREAIARRRQTETPIETARRIREKYGLVLREETKRPLPRDVYDEMWDDR